MIGLIVRGLSQGAAAGIGLGVAIGGTVAAVYMDYRRTLKQEKVLEAMEGRFDQMCGNLERGGRADIKDIVDCAGLDPRILN